MEWTWHCMCLIIWLQSRYNYRKPSGRRSWGKLRKCCIDVLTRICAEQRLWYHNWQVTSFTTGDCGGQKSVEGVGDGISGLNQLYDYYLTLPVYLWGDMVDWLAFKCMLNFPMSDVPICRRKKFRCLIPIPMFGHFNVYINAKYIF